MGDFFQNGVITTFQELGPRDYERYEAEISKFAHYRPLPDRISRFPVTPSDHADKIRNPSAFGL